MLVSVPASVDGESPAARLMQIKVRWQLPKMWLVLRRLVNLEKQVDGILPVCVWRSQTHANDMIHINRNNKTVHLKHIIQYVDKKLVSVIHQ